MRSCFALLILTLGLFAGCTTSDNDGGSPDGGNSQQAGNQNNGGSSGNGNKTPSDAGDAGPGTSNADSGVVVIPTLDAGDAAGPMSTLVDPAPDADAPGEYTCEGCPDADITDFNLDLGSASTQLFSGNVAGAIGNGQFYLVSAGGQAIGGSIPTSETGSYQFTAPLFCGTQLLKCLWSNESGTYVAVVEIVTSDCVDADIRVTLTWTDQGYDFELHLIKEGGQINDNATDCTWTSCIGAGPDWGTPEDLTDNPRKDVDNTGTYGPENIFYASPEDGTYTVMVEHWGNGSPESDGQVTINLKDQAPVTIDIADLAPQHVFTAATISWPSKQVSVIGDDYDCSGNWIGGCKDAIP